MSKIDRKDDRQNRAVLLSAVANQALVRVVRAKIEQPEKHLVGVLSVIGVEWVVLARFTDELNFDGFDCLRVGDITRCELSFPRRKFYLAALRSTRARYPAIPHIDPTSTASLLQSASNEFALLVLERELSHEGADIGRVRKLSPKSCELQLVSPDATVLSRRATLEFSQLTRIGFGNSYEQTLATVARVADPRWREG